MIPTLTKEQSLQHIYLEYLESLKQSDFQGDICDDFATRLITSTDNSIYQVLPQAVLYPKTQKDIETIVQFANKPQFSKTIKITGRGGGTGTDGQSLTQGIVVDFSKHMNNILEINIKEGFVRVQPGVIVDHVNAQLAEHDLALPLYISTSNRATLGGMVNTDASGKGSLYYGRTSDHILEMDIILSNGKTWKCKKHQLSPQSNNLKNTKANSPKTSLENNKHQTEIACQTNTTHTKHLNEQHNHLKQNNDISKNDTSIEDTIKNITYNYQDAIQEGFPKLHRFMTGYNLAMACNPETRALNLQYLIAGSEGTLGLVTEIKFELTKTTKHKKLLLIAYNSFDEALTHAQAINPFKPSALESIDERLLELAKTDILYHQLKPIFAIKPDAKAINLVEIMGNEESELETQMQSIINTCNTQHEERTQEATSLPDKQPSIQYNRTNKTTNNHQGIECTTLATKAIDTSPYRPTTHPYYSCQNNSEVSALWELRKKSVGLLGNQPGNRKPVPFVEDTVVDPKDLPEFIKAFRQILDKYNIDYGMFGHADIGCIHVRPALDLKQESDEILLKNIFDKVFKLVKKFNGVMWGEHGQGFRSEYSAQQFGNDLYPAIREVKTLFDPDNRFNPGKIALPYDSRENLVTFDGSLRGFKDRKISQKMQSDFPSPMNCNGNGLCYNQNTAQAFCPSYKVSKDRLQSPKGRSMLMKEWLYQLSNNGYNLTDTTNLTNAGYTTSKASIQNNTAKPQALSKHKQHTRKGPTKALKIDNHITKEKKNNAAPLRSDQYDFSHDVYKAFKTCLSCKTCANECPIHVDIPNFKSKFLAHYHNKYKRPFKDWFISRIENLLPLLSKTPRTINLINKFKLTQKITGMCDLPSIASPNIKKLCKINNISLYKHNNFNHEGTIFITTDFTSYYYNPKLIINTYKLLANITNKNVEILPFIPNGKAYNNLGFIKRFINTAKINVSFIQGIKQHYPNAQFVSIEPSIGLTYRDEYKEYQKYLNDFDVPVLLIQELLSEALNTQSLTPCQPNAKVPNNYSIGSNKSNANNSVAKKKISRLQETNIHDMKHKNYKLLLHCTEKASIPEGANQWKQIFDYFGLNLEFIPTGCCGMAGSYGHELEHYDSSKKLYEMSWKNIIENNSEDIIIATGFSCRSQVKRFSNIEIKHPIDVLSSILK